MIKFECLKKRTWNIIIDEEQIELHLNFSPTVNKIEIIIDFIEKLSKHFGSKFDNWFYQFIQINKLDELESSIDDIKKFCDSYIDSLNINWSKYIDRSKIKKTSIVFLEEDIEKLIKLSSYLKIFSIRSQSSNCNLGDRLNKIAFNLLLKNKEDIMLKIFDLCRSKTFAYSMSDSYMWTYLKNTLNKDIGTYAMEIFNHIMNHIITLCKTDMNPIVFLVTVIDSSIGFIFKGIYKNTLIFESGGNSVDYQNLTYNSLRTCLTKDAISRLRSVSYKYAIERIRENCAKYDLHCHQQETEFTNRIMSLIEFTSPVCNYILIPLLTRILEIPYSSLRCELKPNDSALIGMYLNHSNEKIFAGKFKNLFDLLDLYAISDIPKLSSFKIRNVDTLINNLDHFYYCKAIETPSNIISQVIGKICRVSYCDILTGKPIRVFPSIEKDTINFFCHFFSDKFDYDQMKRRFLKDI